MSCAVALFADTTARAWDIRVSGGRVVMDFTPATIMLVALGSDRRAEAGDVLPDDLSKPAGAVLSNPRRGAVSDSLNAAGDRMGSRLWLLERSKLDDVVVPGQARAYGAEAMAVQQARIGAAVSVTSQRTATNALTLTCAVGNTKVSVPAVSA